mgnify:FL=1
MSKVKLLICYHKKAPLFKDNILTPIHVGRANAEQRLDHESENYKWLKNNMIGDNTGDNISALNDSYNEMTALYWAWKNYDKLGNPDYVGLMHYRRHFVLHEGKKIVYNIQDFNPDTYFDIIGYSEEKMNDLVEGCDFVTHIGHVQNVYHHFIENQRKTDIDLANDIVLEKYPEYKEIMGEYYAGDDSNFCNMNIFSKDLFFKYCEWIFDILGEFEKRVDINEKRFFISERLTGMFIAKLMKDKNLKYKILPISFIEEPMNVPVVLPINKENMLSSAMTMTSIMENSKGYHTFEFYILADKTIVDEYRDKYKMFAEKYEKCVINFMDTNISDEFLPIYVSQILKNVNKCIYIYGDVLALFDIGEFYRICSVDDYFAVGIPEDEYLPEEKAKKISDSLLVLNCKRIRKHMIAEKADAMSKELIDGKEAFNQLCANEIGYIPWYLYTSERLESFNGKLFRDDKTRGRIQEETLWRPFIIYDYESPIENNQGVYSIFWWNMVGKLPLFFQKIPVNISVLCNLYTIQQKEINSKKMVGTIASEVIDNSCMDNIHEVDTATEDWRSYGLWGKLKFYYKHNGFKNTVIFLKNKLFGRRG